MYILQSPENKHTPLFSKNVIVYSHYCDGDADDKGIQPMGYQEISRYRQLGPHLSRGDASITGKMENLLMQLPPT